MASRAKVQDESRLHTREDLWRWTAGQMKQPGCRLAPPVQSQLAREIILSEAVLRTAELGYRPPEHERAKKAFLERAREINDAYRARRLRNSRRTKKPHLPTEPTEKMTFNASRFLSTKETKREAVLSSELSRLAGGHPWVMRFRKDILHGRMLTETDASALCGSVAASYFEPEFFERERIPLWAHTSRAFNLTDLEQGASEQKPKQLIRIEWSGGRQDVVVGFMERPRVGSFEVPRLVEAWQLGISHTLDRGARHFIVVPCLVSANSVLAHLGEVTKRLAKVFLLNEVSAVLFVLTGKAALCPAITANESLVARGPSHLLARALLEVQPWVSANTVRRLYLQVQREMLGKRNRGPSVKRLEFFDRVSQLRSEGATWEEAAQRLQQQRRIRLRAGAATSPAKRLANDYFNIGRQLLRPFYGHSIDPQKRKSEDPA